MTDQPMKRRGAERRAREIVSLVTRREGVVCNVGAKATSGKYLPTDSDDMYCLLELEVAFMETHPDIGMVSTNMSAMRVADVGNITLIDISPIFHDYGWTRGHLFGS
jgi:hypothetical protein